MSPVCRVCLAGHLQLHSVDNILLREVYERLSNTKFISEDGRSRGVCCFCYQKLLKCHTFSMMARRSDKIISELFFKGLEATPETITKLNIKITEHLAVTPSLSTTDSIIYNTDKEIPIESDFVTIKEEPVIVKEESTSEEFEWGTEFGVDEDIPNTSVLVTIDEPVIEKEGTAEYECENTESNIGKGIPDNSVFVTIKEEPTIVNVKRATEDELMEIERDIDRLPEESVFITIKEEAIFLKEERNIDEENHTVETEVHSNISKENIKQQIKFKAGRSLDISKRKLIPKINNTNKTKHTDIYLRCGDCTKIFKDKSKLIAHIRKAHTASDKKRKQSRSGDTSAPHVRPHSGEKTYDCTICEKQFTRKYDLNTHTRIHTGEKPYTCNVCDKQFVSRSCMTRHMKIHTGVKYHACDRCDKQFSLKNNLNRHRITHTGEKSYACDQCDSQFNTKCNLDRHKRTHTGEKPYTCDRCERQFSHKSTLTSHMRIHTGEKPYACNKCDRKFTVRSSLKYHIYSNHKKVL